MFALKLQPLFPLFWQQLRLLLRLFDLLLIAVGISLSSTCTQFSYLFIWKFEVYLLYVFLFSVFSLISLSHTHTHTNFQALCHLWFLPLDPIQYECSFLTDFVHPLKIGESSEVESVNWNLSQHISFPSKHRSPMLNLVTLWWLQIIDFNAFFLECIIVYGRSIKSPIQVTAITRSWISLFYNKLTEGLPLKVAIRQACKDPSSLLLVSYTKERAGVSL